MNKTLRRFETHRLTRCVASSVLLAACTFTYAVDSLDVRRDAREPAFAQVMNFYYQNKPYEALTTLLAHQELSFNAVGTVNVMLGDLYSKYGLSREADAALSRAVNSDVTAQNRNAPWLRFGKLLYQTRQDSLALNFLNKPPNLMSPMQESERILMLCNVLMRQDRVNEAIKLLSNYQTPSPFYRQLARYNLALAYLIPPTKISAVTPADKNSLTSKTLPDGQLAGITDAQRAAIALRVMDSITLLDPNQEIKPSKNSKIVIENTDIQDTDVTEAERYNLNDKIALSKAYLFLQLKQPENAKNALRNVRLESPYSNQALLTSTHVYWQLGDFKRALNFAKELSNRNPNDPLVQESWILAARCLEELKAPAAVEQYKTIINLYKNQLAEISQVKRDIDSSNILNIFPVTETDPILLGLPAINKVPNAGIWVLLLDQGDILANIQQNRQTYLLQSKLSGYENRLKQLNTRSNLSPEQLRDLRINTALLKRVKVDFAKSLKDNQKQLADITKGVFEQRQAKLDTFVTEALLGLQRVEHGAVN